MPHRTPRWCRAKCAEVGQTGPLTNYKGVLKCQSFPLLLWKMNPQNNLELLRPLGLLPIRRWSSNLLEANILKLNYRKFTMLLLMGGAIRISIDAVIRRDGHWLSLRQPRASSLVASQQLNGNPHSQLCLSPHPTRSCSVWMRAANTLSRAETKRLLDVTEITVQGLGLLVSVT
jgi:hypothetical protein